MTSKSWLTVIAIITVFLSGAAVSEMAQAKSRHHKKPSSELRVVSTSSLPGHMSYGWRYYSNPRVTRAVVISPSGEYFLSRGDGPKQVTGPAGGVLTTQPAKQ